MFATIRKVSNLEEKFAALKEVADQATAFALTDIERAPGSGSAVDLFAHQQGMCKVDGTGNFFVSGCVYNTNRNSTDRPYFYVLKDFKGSKAVGGRDYYQIDNEYNILLRDVDFTDHRRFTHAGGIQVAENVLAVGLEDYNGDLPAVHNDRSLVRFYDVKDETNIQEITGWGFGRIGDKLVASAIGLTKRNDQWLLAVREHGQISIYTLIVKMTGYQPQYSWKPVGQPIPYGVNNEITEFQGIDLFLSDDNRVYLFGSPNGESDDDIMWLHELQFTYGPGDVNANRAVGLQDIPARYVDKVHFHRKGSGPRFKDAACVYVNEQGDFEVYSAEMHAVDNQIRCNGWNIK